MKAFPRNTILSFTMLVLPGLCRLSRHDAAHRRYAGPVARDVNGTTKATFDGKEFDFATGSGSPCVKPSLILAGSRRSKPEMADFVNHELVEKLVKRLNASHTPHMPYDPKIPGQNDCRDV